LRAYGHQSERDARNCEDTALLADFAAVADNGPSLVGQAEALTARGYTPITLALTLAAGDIAREEAGERIVILVSDGQETCDADPCVAARALAEADARLAIHTIGFGASDATRTQLQCIASQARGTYFDAADSRSLAAVLQQAAVAAAAPPTVVTIERPTGPGILRVEPSWPGASFPVLDAETGAEIADINGAAPEVELPPGTYNVQFTNGLWRGVVVNPGETTVLTVGLLQIEGGQNDLNGYDLTDPETLEIFADGKVFYMLPLMPTPVTIVSGQMAWPNVEIRAGETTVINPGRITVTGAQAGSYTVSTAAGAEAGTVSRLLQLPLPPGDYVVHIERQTLPVHLEEGQTVEVQVP